MISHRACKELLVVAFSYMYAMGEKEQEPGLRSRCHDLSCLTILHYCGLNGDSKSDADVGLYMKAWLQRSEIRMVANLVVVWYSIVLHFALKSDRTECERRGKTGRECCMALGLETQPKEDKNYTFILGFVQSRGAELYHISCCAVPLLIG